MIAAAFSGCTRRVSIKAIAEPFVIFELLPIVYLVSAISIIVTGTVHGVSIESSELCASHKGGAFG